MKALEERILADGVVINNDILKVDSFLNHQIDVTLARELAKEIAHEYRSLGVNKILTIETSGIAFAYAVAEEMSDLPLVFAKKSKSATVGEDVFKAEIKSFTRNTISTVTVRNIFLKPGGFGIFFHEKINVRRVVRFHVMNNQIIRILAV